VSDEPVSARVGLLKRVAAGFDLLPVLAFLTDEQNRFIWVNQTFAREIGDPIRERLSPSHRFVPAAIAGPYRQKFPRWKREISQCLAGLYQQVDLGNLSPSTLSLINQTLKNDRDLMQATARSGCGWDGTMLVKDSTGHHTLVSEKVLPVPDLLGRNTGFHVSLWFPAEQGEPSSSEDPSGSSIDCLLTARQIEIARLFASGLSADDVAAAAGISWRTARAHLEHIYSRLDVHSKTELILSLQKHGLSPT
jgi:DNA-binding CsgD family transcriptional regulator